MLITKHQNMPTHPSVTYEQQRLHANSFPSRTHPEDEVEGEEQIFHAFHPALHFAHDVA